MRFCVFFNAISRNYIVRPYVRKAFTFCAILNTFCISKLCKDEKCFQLNISADRRTDWSIECRFAPKKSIFLKFSPTKIFRMDQNISCLINSLTLLTIIREINLFHFIPNDLKNEMPRMNSLAYAKKICYGHNIFSLQKVI